MSAFSSYWQERLTKNFNLSGVGFDGVGEAFNRWLYRLRAKHFNSLVRKYIGPGMKSARVVDVGTGTGFYLNLLLRWRTQKAEAIDFNTISIDKLPAQFRSVVFHSFDISDELPSQLIEQFDLVVCVDVLFHVVNDDRYSNAIRNLSQLLKTNGILIMTENLCSKKEVRGHIVDRTQEEIYAQLSKSTFKVLEERSLFVLMNKPIKSNHKFWVEFSTWRIQFLKKNKEHKRESLNYLLGMLLYGLEIIGSLFFIKGKGTSFIVCQKISPKT